MVFKTDDMLSRLGEDLPLRLCVKEDFDRINATNQWLSRFPNEG